MPLSLTVNKALTSSAPPPPSKTLAATFGKAPPASPFVAATAAVMTTPLQPSPPIVKSFFGAKPAPFGASAIGAAVSNYAPAVMTTTTLPTPSQAPPAAQTGGMFATLGKFSAPTPPPAWLTVPGTFTAVSGLNAPPVATAPRPRPTSIVAAIAASFNPPAAFPSTNPVSATTFLDPNTLPAAMPPMTPATKPTEGTTGTPTTALPSGAALVAAGVDPYGTGYTPQGGFDPYGGSMPALSQDAAAAAPAVDYGKIALYGGGALAGLFVLSRMFGRSAA